VGGAVQLGSGRPGGRTDDSVTPMEYSPLVQILILLAAVLGGLLVVIVTVSVCTFVASRLRAAKRYINNRTPQTL